MKKCICSSVPLPQSPDRSVLPSLPAGVSSLPGWVPPYSEPATASSSHPGCTKPCGPASCCLSALIPSTSLLFAPPGLTLKQVKQALASRPWSCCLGSSLPGFCSACSLTLFTSSLHCHLLKRSFHSISSQRVYCLLPPIPSLMPNSAWPRGGTSTILAE